MFVAVFSTVIPLFRRMPRAGHETSRARGIVLLLYRPFALNVALYPDSQIRTQTFEIFQNSPTRAAGIDSARLFNRFRVPRIDCIGRSVSSVFHRANRIGLCVCPLRSQIRSNGLSLSAASPICGIRERIELAATTAFHPATRGLIYYGA